MQFNLVRRKHVPSHGSACISIWFAIDTPMLIRHHTKLELLPTATPNYKLPTMKPQQIPKQIRGPRGFITRMFTRVGYAYHGNGDTAYSNYLYRRTRAIWRTQDPSRTELWPGHVIGTLYQHARCHAPKYSCQKGMLFGGCPLSTHSPVVASFLKGSRVVAVVAVVAGACVAVMGPGPFHWHSFCAYCVHVAASVYALHASISPAQLPHVPPENIRNKSQKQKHTNNPSVRS